MHILLGRHSCRGSFLVVGTLPFEENLDLVPIQILSVPLVQQMLIQLLLVSLAVLLELVLEVLLFSLLLEGLLGDFRKLS